jgi:hypothetical protein
VAVKNHARNLFPASACVRDQNRESVVLQPLYLNPARSEPATNEACCLLNAVGARGIAGDKTFCDQSLIGHPGSTIPAGPAADAESAPAS